MIQEKIQIKFLKAFPDRILGNIKISDQRAVSFAEAQMFIDYGYAVRVQLKHALTKNDNFHKPEPTMKIEFTKSFGDRILGNIYPGKNAVLPVKQANKFIKDGRAVKIQAPAKEESSGNNNNSNYHEDMNKDEAKLFNPVRFPGTLKLNGLTDAKAGINDGNRNRGSGNSHAGGSKNPSAT